MTLQIPDYAPRQIAIKICERSATLHLLDLLGLGALNVLAVGWLLVLQLRTKLVDQGLPVLFLLNGSLVETALDVAVPKDLAKNEDAEIDDRQTNGGREAPSPARTLSDRKCHDIEPDMESPTAGHL